MALALTVMAAMPSLWGSIGAAKAQAPGHRTPIDFDSILFSSTRTRSGTVRFTHGKYREPLAPGSVSELVMTVTDHWAMGLVNGEEAVGVVLTSDLGGSGTFYDLALLMKKTGGWRHVDTMFLGDRVRILSVIFHENRLIVDLISHAPHDPLCCPSSRVKRVFAVDTGRLVLVKASGDDDSL